MPREVIAVESDTDTTTRYEESYRVTTKFSGNKALPGVHVHTLVTDLQNGRDESDVYLVVDSTNGTILKLDLPLSEGRYLGSPLNTYEGNVRCTIDARGRDLRSLPVCGRKC